MAFVDAQERGWAWRVRAPASQGVARLTGRGRQGEAARWQDPPPCAVEPCSVPLTRKRKIELLRGVTLFADLPERALATVAAKTVDIAYAPGQYIVRQGQVGTGVYLIVDGHARVVRGHQTLARLGPGDFFGELSILDQQPRVAHVVAEEPTTCLALASWDFAKVLERHPKIALALLRGMAQRLRTATATPSVHQ